MGIRTRYNIGEVEHPFQIPEFHWQPPRGESPPPVEPPADDSLKQLKEMEQIRCPRCRSRTTATRLVDGRVRRTCSMAVCRQQFTLNEILA